jgi:hypothetical protein
LSCVNPGKLQAICDSLEPEQIERVFLKWLERIPLRIPDDGDSRSETMSITIPKSCR